MINSKKKLNEIIKHEFLNYFTSRKSYFRALCVSSPHVLIWRYQKFLRHLEYYKNKIDRLKSYRPNHTKCGILVRLKNKISLSFAVVYYGIFSRKVNIIGRKIGIDAWHSIFDEGLIIYHSSGGIIINSKSRVGKNCHLHGNNCIGNNGSTKEAPQIGDNCSLGVGAKVIGNIRLGNNIKIAAGAVVIRDCLEDGVILAGMPAKVK